MDAAASATGNLVLGFLQILDTYLTPLLGQNLLAGFGLSDLLLGL